MKGKDVDFDCAIKKGEVVALAEDHENDDSAMDEDSGNGDYVLHNEDFNNGIF